MPKLASGKTHTGTLWQVADWAWHVPWAIARALRHQCADSVRPAWMGCSV